MRNIIFSYINIIKCLLVKETYTKFKSKDPTVAFDLYDCLFLPWSLNSSSTNFGIAAIIERDNKWDGFSLYLQAYIRTPPPKGNNQTSNRRSSPSTSTPSTPSGGGGGGY